MLALDFSISDTATQCERSVESLLAAFKSAQGLHNSHKLSLEIRTCQLMLSARQTQQLELAEARLRGVSERLIDRARPNCSKWTRTYRVV
jgi:hypothetical protein